MNIIHRLQLDKVELAAERSTLLQGMADLRAYLLSDKFRCGSDRDGYVNINDVLLRLEETKSAATIAGEDERAKEQAAMEQRKHWQKVAHDARDARAVELNS